MVMGAASMRWTAVKFANAAARVFGLDDEGKTRLHRVVRNQVSKLVLPTVADPNDKRAPRLFDDNTAAVALLLIPMADMDMTVRAQREAAAAMFARSTTFHPRPGETVRVPMQIEEALAATREGKQVELVTQLAWRAHSGQIHRHTWLEFGGMPTGRTADIVTASIDALAELRIPASKLLGEFFAKEAE